MIINSQFWICRKEIAELLHWSCKQVERNEESLGISLLRVTVNRRVVLFPRKETIEQLQKRIPCLKL